MSPLRTDVIDWLPRHKASRHRRDGSRQDGHVLFQEERLEKVSRVIVVVLDISSPKLSPSLTA